MFCLHTRVILIWSIQGKKKKTPLDPISQPLEGRSYKHRFTQKQAQMPFSSIKKRTKHWWRLCRFYKFSGDSYSICRYTLCYKLVKKHLIFAFYFILIVIIIKSSFQTIIIPDFFTLPYRLWSSIVIVHEKKKHFFASFFQNI